MKTRGIKYLDPKNDLTFRKILERTKNSASAFSEEELLFYDQYWDAVRVEKAALEDLQYQKDEIEIIKETGLSADVIEKL